MPKIKIVDVESDDYAVTVDALKENELPDKNEPFEAAEETTAIVQEKDEGTTEEVSIDTITAEPTKKIREQQLVQCEKCGKYVSEKTMKYTHHLKCGIVKNSRGGRPKKSQIKIKIDMAANTVSPADISTKVRGEVNFKDNE